MRSKALLFSNLYSTAFLGWFIYWIIGFLYFEIDYFQLVYNYIYTGCMNFPIIAFPIGYVVFEPLNLYSGLFYFGGDPGSLLFLGSDVPLYLLMMILALVLTTLGVTLGWFGYAKNKSGLALVSAIIFLLVSLCMPIASIFTLPLVAFSFLGYGIQKAIKK